LPKSAPHTAPLIGITGRRRSAAVIGAPPGFADAPAEVYLSEYATSVLEAGGLPVHLALDSDPAAIVERLDGIVLAGGDDVDPRRYGQVPGPHTALVDPPRDEFEFALVLAALDAGVPLLGVCRGAQVLNVALGGTLVQHLAHGEGESHGSYAYPRAHRVHDIATEPGSILASLYGHGTRVNSFHHQAVDIAGAGVVVTGRAPDGVVEAIEVPGSAVLGVQWHPETFDGDPAFRWLVDEALNSAAQTRIAA